MYELNGKTAIVTGAGGRAGIGRGIAKRLAAEGASVAVCDLNYCSTPDWGGLQAVVDEIEFGDVCGSCEGGLRRVGIPKTPNK